LLNAKQALRQSFIKVSADISDAQREIRYGTLTSKNLAELYKHARSTVWPLLGVGTLVNILVKMREGVMEPDSVPNPMEINEPDLIKARALLNQGCQSMNEVCREAFEHVLMSLQLGKYSKPSLLGRLFRTQKRIPRDSEMASDIGTTEFLSRFDTVLEKFYQERANGVTSLYDEKAKEPSHALFLVVFVHFQLYSTAQEIRSLVQYVDTLRSQGALTRNRLIFPDFLGLIKSVLSVFQRQKAHTHHGYSNPLTERAHSEFLAEPTKIRVYDAPGVEQPYR
jgi:hypothetical protein